MPAETMSLAVLYLDNHLMVVNKPPGLLAQADKTGDTDLLSLAREHVKRTFSKPGKAYLGLVHRLDRPVSGVMAFARTSKAAARLSEQFRNNIPLKHYVAIVHGRCRGAGTCRNYLVKENQRVRVVDQTHPRGLYAELGWQCIAGTQALSLLRVELKTGRPHQIRVQLAHMGFPVVGDVRYGASGVFDGRNLALHCYYLKLQHPVQQRSVSWKARPPATWEGFFDDALEAVIA